MFRLPKPRWWTLLTALLLQLILNPCWQSEVQQSLDILLLLLNCAVVVMILHRLSRRRSTLIVGLLLGTPILVLYWIPNTPLILDLLFGFTGAFYLYAIGLSLPHLLRLQKVTIEQIAGALSLYILLGLTWAIAFYFVERGVPGSFGYDHDVGDVLTANLADLVYFSFVTVTTLGYGDIIPVSCIARSLAILEAIFGVGILSIVVGRLIGIQVASIKKETIQ